MGRVIMQITYEIKRYNEKTETYTESVDDFTIAQLLYHSTHWGDRARIHLEQQPEVVCKAMGRLLNLLLEKDLITLQEFHDVVDTEYHLRDITKLQKEE
jgi:hypothetical protein